MKKMFLPLLLLLLTMSCATQTETIKDDFVKGADVGFLTGQEARGQKFYDTKGNERECLELLKNDYQISAVRLRVWVNPRGGSCGKEEVLAMALRAKKLGMDVMIDFHYSDSWADPAKQPIPKAWMGHSFDEMKQDLRNHTIEVLTLLKENGVEPRWVQVGNETTNGMLWNVKTDERGWEIKDENGQLQKGEFTAAVLAPGEVTEVTLTPKKFTFKPGAVYMLNVYAKEAAHLPYAKAGHVHSSEQFVLNERTTPAVPQAKGKTPFLSESDAQILVKAGKITVAVDKATGYLSGYHNGVQQMLKAPFAPNFWRAEIDNDWRGWKPAHYMPYWKSATETLATAPVQVKTEVDGAAVVTMSKNLEDYAQLTMSYTVYPDGLLKVDYEVKIADETLEPLRVGLQGQVDDDFENIAYFGRGPHENYSDRYDGVFLGTWKTTGSGMMFDYIYPQETGNRTDVRWLTMTDYLGSGIQFLGVEPLNVSVWNTTQEELQNATHQGEAKPLYGAFMVNIDHAQAGVGGTDSWSQRARPSDQYRLLEKNYSYTFYIGPVKNFADAVEAGRRLCR